MLLGVPLWSAQFSFIGGIRLKKLLIIGIFSLTLTLHYTSFSIPTSVNAESAGSGCGVSGDLVIEDDAPLADANSNKKKDKKDKKESKPVEVEASAEADGSGNKEDGADVNSIGETSDELYNSNSLDDTESTETVTNSDQKANVEAAKELKTKKSPVIFIGLLVILAVRFAWILFEKLYKKLRK